MIQILRQPEQEDPVHHLLLNPAPVVSLIELTVKLGPLLLRTAV